MENLPRLLVFASGSKDGGGSGFQELVENMHTGVLQAEIVGVVSNYKNGGIRQKADKLGITFSHFPKPRGVEDYQLFVRAQRADFVALSGWLKLTIGLDPSKTINIHPGPKVKFGGEGYYGHYVHEAVIAAFKKGEVTQSEVTMHFVDEDFDKGPTFFIYPVKIRDDDTPETLAARVNKIEHGWQSWVTNLVVQGLISWDGKDPKSLKVPDWYPFLPNQ